VRLVKRSRGLLGAVGRVPTIVIFDQIKLIVRDTSRFREGLLKSAYQTDRESLLYSTYRTRERPHPTRRALQVRGRTTPRRDPSPRWPAGGRSVRAGKRVSALVMATDDEAALVPQLASARWFSLARACCRTAGVPRLQSPHVAAVAACTRAALQDYTLAIEHEYRTE